MLSVHDEPDRREVSLKKVGVRNIVGVVYVGDRPFSGRFSLYISLPPENKGAHMSRFAESLYRFSEGGDLCQSGLFLLLKDLQKRHDYSEKVYAKVRFDYLREKRSFRTGSPSYELVPVVLEASDPPLLQILTVEVTGFTCCPCALRETRGRGTHTQRCNLRVSIKCGAMPPPRDFEKFLDDLEFQFSSSISSCLKRSDEAHVIITGFNNPKFVEDVARDTCLFLDKSFSEYAVVVNSFESIHKHDATAVVTKGSFR